jgi:hypothetical protein
VNIPKYDKGITALLVVDPYKGFFAQPLEKVSSREMRLACAQE